MLEIRKLTRRFGSLEAVKDVSLVIHAGNADAMAWILPAIAARPAIFPPPADLLRLERMWTEIKVR